jgi:hypothetical protein
MPSVEDLWATRQLDASRIPLSMRNDSALASRWFWPLWNGHRYGMFDAIEAAPGALDGLDRFT